MFQCSYCGKEYKTKGNLCLHERTCDLNPNRVIEKYECKYCGRTTTHKRGNLQHEVFCELNPNNHRDNIHPWNKGLTKDTSAVIAQCAKKFSQRIQNGEILGGAGRTGNDNFSCRPDVRSKISATMMGNHNNNPNKTGRGKKGWYKGFFCSSTYELAFVIYCIDNGIPIERCTDFYEYEYESKRKRYYPDFIVNNTIVEIKGYRTAQVDAKTASVRDRDIVVLYRDDLTSVFDYIFNVYGKTVDKDIDDLYENMGS